jgi:hypothetical protein
VGAPGAAAATGASQTVELSATLTPERLGRGTTVGFGFDISALGSQTPSPLVGVELLYPSNFGFVLSGLGLATCEPATLASFGPKACPPNSRMGFGSAIGQLAAEGSVVPEVAQVAIFRGPTQEGHLALLFYVDGSDPVRAQIVFPGLLIPAGPPFGGAVSLDVPLIPSWPEGPNVALVRLRSTLGPEHLTYYRSVAGRTVPYTPQGILLPRVCPRRGFNFAAKLTFADGSTVHATTSVACPGGTP